MKKEFKLWFFDGTKKETVHVYAKNIREARKNVANLFYIDEKVIFPA